jgi:lipopolysaccharide transport system permease protein
MRSRPKDGWRWLLVNFVQREVTSRYAGSASGLAWTVLNPLAQLAILALVFGTLLRVPENMLGGVSFAAFLSLALWPWLMFNEGLKRAIESIPANASLIRKVAFPHELLIYSAVASSFVVNIVGWVAVLVALSLFGEPIRWTGLLLAVPLLAAQFAFTVGLSAALAAAQVVLRDVEHALGIALSILFYATPIVYPLAMIPQPWRDWIALNPLAYMVGRYRDLIAGTGGMQWQDFAVLAASLVVLAAGIAAFRRISPYFEDLL